MLTTILVFSIMAITIGFIGLIFDNGNKKVMNQYCLSECVAGKHYKEKGNMYNIY